MFLPNPYPSADGGSQVSKQGAMGVVPFSLSPPASSFLQSFASGRLHFLSLGLGPDCTIVPSTGVGGGEGVNIAGAVGSRPLAGELVKGEPR